MGNALSCYETGSWDPHPEVKDAYKPAPDTDYHDMNQPLSHYFISSGHNSYLTGNQLTSASGTATIVKCLQAGCRVVELDVYNGPVCTHGGTLTGCVDFKECVEAVAAHAFTNSKYPVIITMENHADPENQAKMARALREVLGEKLFVPDPEDPGTAYLSPHALRGKVLLRTSLKKDAHEDFRRLIYIQNAKFTSLGEMIKREKVVSSSFEEGALPRAGELEQRNSDGTPKQASMPRLRPLQQPGGSPQGAARLCCLPKRKPGGRKAAAQAAAQGATASEAPGPGPAPEDAVRPDEPPVEGSLRELYAYTARHLMRVYPWGLRVLSDNYNPMRAWVRGASLAALNWQNWDRALHINQGMFQRNGGCGYVLKPEWMRAPGAGLPARRPRRLTVEVLSAHVPQGSNCWVWKDDLFVKISVVGMPADCKRQATRAVANSGRLANGGSFPFDVAFPEMAVLLLELMDEDVAGQADADLLAYASLPLASLAEGRYQVALRHPATGEPLADGDTWVKVALVFPPLAPEKEEGAAAQE